jgi:hypothetical protein
MTRPLAVLTVLLALLFSVGPLVHILARHKFQTYSVYFVSVMGFLAFNVVGSLSRNILGRIDTPEFYLLLLVTSLALSGLYPVLIGLAARRTEQGGLRPLAPVAPAMAAGYRRYLWLLLAASLAGAALVFVAVAPPLILRFDLYGNTGELMIQRTHIVLESGLFGWMSIFLFEIPAFLVALLALLRGLAWARNDPQAATGLTRLLLVALPISALLSVSYFHVTMLVNLVVELALVSVYVRGRIPMRLVARYAVPGTVLVVLMYVGKQGTKLTGDSLRDLGALLAHRVFEVYAWGGATVTYLFPAQLDFLRGRSFINYFGLFDFEQVNVSTLVYPYIYGYTNGSSPVPAVYEGYANFGWAGALGVLAVMLVLIGGVSLLSWSNRPFDQALSIYLTVKTLLLWQVALWFGMLDLIMLVAVGMIWVGYRMVVPHTVRGFAALPEEVRLPGAALGAGSEPVLP